MRLANVLAYQVASLFILDGVCLSNNLDAFATAHRCRLEDVHILVVGHFSVIIPPLELVRQNVRRRTYVKFLPLLSTLFLAVAPQVGFAANAPGPCKMVDLLALVHILQLGGLY